MKKLMVVLIVVVLGSVLTMASILERDHYVDNILDRIESLESKIEEMNRSGLSIRDGRLVIGEGNVRIDTEGIVLVDDGRASVTKLKWKDEHFLGATLGDILADWTQDPEADVVTWIRAFEHPDQTTGEAQIILKVDNEATEQTDDTRVTMHSATHKIVFGGVDLFEIRDDAGDTLYFSADDIEGIIADGVQMKDGYIIAGGLPGVKAKRTSQSIPNAVTTVVSLTSGEDWDTHAFHFGGVNPSRFTVPAGLGGRYAVGAYILSANNLTATKTQIQLRKNGAAFAHQRTEGNTSWARALTIYSEIELAATDHVELTIYQNHGNAQNFRGELYMHRIGD